MWARLNNGIMEIISENPNGKWADGVEFIEVPLKFEKYFDETFMVVNGSFEPSTTSIENIKKALTKDLANIRWLRETGGVELPGVCRLFTDRESRSLIGDCLSSFKNGFITNCKFKSASGWVDITIAEIEIIARFIAQFVNDCFIAESITSNKISNMENIDELLAFDVNAEFEINLTTLRA